MRPWKQCVIRIRIHNRCGATMFVKAKTCVVARHFLPLKRVEQSQLV